MTQVHYEATPNPQTMKFNMGCQISQENLQFDDPMASQHSPLAQKIFGFPWVSGVFIGQDFVTITKQDWVDWETIADPLAHLLGEHLNQGLPIVVQMEDMVSKSSTTEINEGDSPVVKRIKEILNSEIRPVVAMDGGDIQFHKYEDNILYLQMRGACSGCPSAMVTLKDGVEVRMCKLIPEIKSVVAVAD